MQQWCACAPSRARNVYCKRFLDFDLGIPAGGRGRRNFAAANARNFMQPVYRRLTLFAGDVFFDEVGMLQAGEFDGETVLDMADHPAPGLADGRSEKRPV